jgi:hypothetical protein
MDGAQHNHLEPAVAAGDEGRKFARHQQQRGKSDKYCCHSNKPCCSRVANVDAAVGSATEEGETSKFTHILTPNKGKLDVQLHACMIRHIQITIAPVQVAREECLASQSQKKQPQEAN